MIAEDGGLLRQVAIDIEHSAVIMAEHAHTVGAHGGGNARGVDPLADFVPRGRFSQVAGDQMIGDAGAVEHAGDLGRGAAWQCSSQMPVMSPRSPRRLNAS